MAPTTEKPQQCTVCHGFGHNKRTCKISKKPVRKVVRNGRAVQSNALIQALQVGVSKKTVLGWIKEFLHKQRIDHLSHTDCTFGNEEECIGDPELVENPCRRNILVPLDGRQRTVLLVQTLKVHPDDDAQVRQIKESNFGLFTAINIKEGQVVTEFKIKYWRKVKPTDGTKAQRYCVRVWKDRGKRTFYMYGVPDLESHHGQSGRAHRANHCCKVAESNLVMVQEEGPNIPSDRWPRIFLLAARDIQRGEELVYNYSGQDGKLEECDICVCEVCCRERRSKQLTN